MTVTAPDQAHASYHFYQSDAEQVQSEFLVLRALQQRGLAEFRRLGFPVRRDEDWRYAPVTEFLKHQFQRARTHINQEDALAAMLLNKQADVPWGNKLAIANGVVLGLAHLREILPPSVLILPIAEALKTCPEKITPYLDNIVTAQHGFHAQNAAMLGMGLFIYVPAHVCIAEPILLAHWQTQAEQAVYLRHVIVVESGATLTVIEDYQGPAELSYYTNTMTEAWVGAQACLKHYKVQRESNAAFHVGHLAVRLAMGSHVDSHIFSIGALWSRFDACFSLSEPKAHCVLNGIYAPGDHQHMDHHTWVYHNVPEGTSQQDYKGVLTGSGHGVFNGQVHVARDAQKTIARQQNKNLLLSKQAEIDTKPQLDIAADDVQCTHGATVGQLDAEALFYFATRGIGVQEATQYLIEGFVAENVQAIEHQAFATWLKSQIIVNSLGANYA